MAALAGQPFSLVRPRGLDFIHRNSPTDQKYLPETMGGGVAMLDYDNDGRLDLFFVNSGRLGTADIGRSNPMFWNRLYRQNADGSFTDVTAKAGLQNAGNVYGMGAAVGDIDGDSYADLYVTNFGANQLYRNNGNGTFTDITEKAGVAAGGWSVSAAFLDYDRDGKLDLFVARYLDWDVSRNILCGTPFNAYCGPVKYSGTVNLLFRNEGNGRFRDVSAETGIGAVVGKGMGVAVNDADGDGFPDIFVSNDAIAQYLFHNEGGRKFKEIAMDAGVALSDDARTYSGMGAAFADYDNDGRPDIVATNLAMERYALYRNDGPLQFSYTSLVTGLAGLTGNSSGWGVGIHDFDNDGWKDIFAAQSHVLDNVAKIQSGIRYLEPPALYRNTGSGKFERANMGGAMPAVAGRGAAFGDLDNDGSLDAVVGVLGGAPLVLMNRTSKPGVTVRVEQGEGAVIRCGTQTVFVTTSGSYLSASDGRAHLAPCAGPADVTWSDGATRKLPRLPANLGLITRK